jgi:hypothetical protein
MGFGGISPKNSILPQTIAFSGVKESSNATHFQQVNDIQVG